MAKRITLNKLISYISTNCIKETDVGKNSISDLINDDNTNENVVFNILKTGKSQTISDIPPNLKSIFDPFIKNLIRHNSIQNLKNSDYNCSLYFCILFCLFDDFPNSNYNEQELFLINFKNKILEDINGKNLFHIFNYKSLKWKQKDLIESIDKFKNNKMVLKFLSDYLSINIFLLNIVEDKIYAIYSESEFNLFKNCIFMTYFNEVFEPLSYINNSNQLNNNNNVSNMRTFNYDHEILKKIVNVDKLKISLFDEEKSFVVGSNSIPVTADKSKEDIAQTKHNSLSKDKDKDDHDVVVVNNIFITQDEKKTINVSSDDDKIKEMADNQANIENIQKFAKKNNIIIKDLDKEFIKELYEIDLKTKLIDIQNIAKKYKIELMKENNGKTKAKTKAEIYTELIEL